MNARRGETAAQRARLTSVDDLAPDEGRYAYWVRWVMYGPAQQCHTPHSPRENRLTADRDVKGRQG